MSALPEPALALPDMNGRSAEEILSWAFGEYSPEITVACSMQDAVVVDLAAKVEPTVEVFFLNTGFHFQETLETSRRLRERYRVNLVELGPVHDPAVYSQDGYEACCADRKVRPLEEYLADKRAWISGIRHAESASRTTAKAIEWDPKRRIVKINPIVAWSDEEVTRYIAENDVLVNPLRYRGYESIGCFPCTAPGSGRKGRWAGTEKTECGLHAAEPSLTHPPVRQ